MTKSLIRPLSAVALLHSALALAQLQIVTPFAGSSCAGSTFANAISASGALTCATPSAGSVVLNNIAAATGANTIANGNNSGQIWNWANTTDSTTAFTFGETSAATNGTSTGGVPNQVLLKATTLATSTQSPLSVYSRGNYVFGVSPTTTQVLASQGTGAGAPTYSFAGAASSGMYAIGSNTTLVSNGNVYFQTDDANGFLRIASVVSDRNYANIAIAWPNSGQFVVAQRTNTSSQYFYVDTSTEGRFTRGSGDATSGVLKFRKARGSGSSPTVITTGDDLGIISGHGYVGGTNTYREAARIAFTSVGTISDATNGIGGNMDFSTQKQGVDTSPVVRARIDQSGHVLSLAGTANTPSMGSCGTSPSVAGTDNAMLITVGTGGSATSCAVTFGTAWGTAPVCIAQNDTDIVPYKIVATTSGVTITASAAFTASSNFNVLCMGRQ